MNLRMKKSLPKTYRCNKINDVLGNTLLVLKPHLLFKGTGLF